MTASMGSLLRDAGLERGHHVGLLAPNGPLFVAGVAACRQSGWVVVPLAPSLPDRALAERVRQADVDAILAVRGEAERAVRLAPGGPVVEAAGDASGGSRVQGGAALVPRDGNDLVALLFTSGTTGAARVWGFPESALATHSRAACRRLGLDGGSVQLGVLPLHHAGGFMMLDRALRLDGHLVLEDRFDAGRVADGMRSHAVTHVSLVPVMLSGFMQAMRAPPASLRCVLLGGDAVPGDLLSQACNAGWPIFVTYGLTETCSQAATAIPTEACAHPGTAGKPLDGVRVRVRRADGSRCDALEEGEIVVEGATLAWPYPGAEAAEAEARGTLTTGDSGYLDDAGRLFVTGRDVHRIVTGGHTVAALHVEDALESIDAVDAACVVGLPDGEWGQTVAALVAAAPAGRLDERSLLDSLKARLAVYEVPRRLMVVDGLPLTASGKKDRAAARRLLASSQEARAGL